MASTRSIISPGVFALSATTVIPPTPVQGVAYRNAALVVPGGANGGWSYAVKVNSADYNQIMYSYSTLLDSLDKRGILGYTDLINYSVGAIAMGSDNIVYRCIQLNGPGTAVQDPTTAPLYWQALVPALVPVAQCQLSKSGANIVLMPKGGNKLPINGSIFSIPAAGVSLAPTGLTVGALLYVYAYMVGAVMTLEAVVTGHSTDATTGVEIKTGDASRTLVGMVRPITGPAFADTQAQRFVLSYYNRRTRGGSANFTANRSQTDVIAFAEVNAEIRNEFLCWADDSISASFSGSMFNSATNATTGAAAIGYDGAAVRTNGVGRIWAADLNTVPVSIQDTRDLAEGYHYATVLGKTANAGNTLTFRAQDDAFCTLQIQTRG